MDATHFQILDINNIILRTGILENTVEIEKRSGDWKIRLLSDTGEIVCEQYLVANNEEYNPRYFIFYALASNVSIYVGSYYDGYDNVEFYKYGISEACATFKLEECKLDLTLDAGRYTVKCFKNNGAWFTFPLRVYTETTEELGEKILGTIASPTEGQISAISLLSNYETIFAELLSSHKQWQSIESFRMLSGYLDIENIRIANLNKHTGITIDALETSGQTVFNKDLDTIIIDQYINGEWIPYRVLKAVSSTQLPEDALYRITGIEAGIFVVAQAYCYVPTAAVKEALWEDNITTSDNQTEQQEVLAIKMANYIELSEEEAQYMYIEEVNSPSSPAIAKPAVEFCDGDLVVTLGDSKLATAISDKLYAVVQEVDLALSGGYKRKKAMDAGVAIFEGSKDFLSDDEIYVVWIEDSSGKAVSLLSFTDVDDSLSSYNDKMRKVRLAETKVSLSAYASQKNSPDAAVFQSMLDYAYSLDEIDTDSIHDYLTAKCISNPRISQMHKTLQLLREHYSRDRIDAGFFKVIYYEKETDELVFPPMPDRPYVLRVTRFNTSEQVIADSYYASSTGAIEIDCSDSEYKILQAIDQQTFELSGFLFVCRMPKQEAMNAWKINLEVLPSWQ